MFSYDVNPVELNPLGEGIVSIFIQVTMLWYLQFGQAKRSLAVQWNLSFIENMLYIYSYGEKDYLDAVSEMQKFNFTDFTYIMKTGWLMDFLSSWPNNPLSHSQD